MTLTPPRVPHLLAANVTSSESFHVMSRSQRQRGLRYGSVASRLLGLRVRIPPGAWMFFSCECCVLSGRGLCVGLIAHPDESYRVWCVWVWSWSLDSEVLAHWGAVEPWKKTYMCRMQCIRLISGFWTGFSHGLTRLLQRTQFLYYGRNHKQPLLITVGTAITLRLIRATNILTKPSSRETVLRVYKMRNKVTEILIFRDVTYCRQLVKVVLSWRSVSVFFFLRWSGPRKFLDFLTLEMEGYW